MPVLTSHRSRTLALTVLGLATLTTLSLMAQAPAAGGGPGGATPVAATPVTAAPFLGEWALTMEQGTLGLTVKVGCEKTARHGAAQTRRG